MTFFKRIPTNCNSLKKSECYINNKPIFSSELWTTSRVTAEHRFRVILGPQASGSGFIAYRDRSEVRLVDR